MIGKLPSRLGVKLFLLLTAVITVSIVPLVYISLKAINDYGDKAFAVHEKQIVDHAFAYLKTISHERAHRYQTFFDSIAASAGLLGRRASELYSDTEFYAENPLVEQRYARDSHNGIWANAIDAPVVSMYWGGEEIDEAVNRELRSLTHMTPFLTRVVEQHPEVLAAHTITMSGIGVYCTLNPKAKKAVYGLPSPEVFDLRDGEPLRIFTDAKQIKPQVRWTSVYKDDVIEGLMLTASAPVIDERTGAFRGISGIDVPLETIVEDILNPDRAESDQDILFSFLLDQSGRLIAFPQRYFSSFGLKFNPEQFIDSSDSLKLSLSDSSRANVRELAQLIAREEDSLTQTEIDGVVYYIATSRMGELGWVYGMVVDKDQLFSSVNESRTALADAVRKLEAEGIIISSLTLLAALAIVYMSVKYLITPLRSLAAATKRVADGDLSVRCPVSTSDETGVLAESFNRMVEQLEAGRKRQQRYADALESEVEQTSQELTDKRGELEMTIERLNREVERRQIVSEALRNAQQQYYETMEATQAGVYIVTEGRFTYVNQSLADMLGTGQHTLIGSDPLDCIVAEDRGVVAENMARRFNGEEIPPYRIQCLREDGSTFYGEVWAKVTVWQGKASMVGTITDVSLIKQNEEKLQLRETQLRQSLEEKETLLKEIYHRTKNNMLVIISMLELQAQDVRDEKITEVFKETENRIRAMALVHEKLYQSQSLSEIDLGSYIREVVISLVNNMAPGGKIGVHFDLQPCPISIDYAVPLGLVINEIVTNSVKHGFPAQQTGRVLVRLSLEQNNTILLDVEDNGVGLANGIDLDSATSFGMQIVSSLIRMQLKGRVTLDGHNGTRYHIRFAKPQWYERV